VSWIEVRSTFSPLPPDTSIFIEIYREFGIENTIEQNDQIAGCFVDVKSTDASIHGLVSALKSAGVPIVEVSELPETDWTEVWKLHFKPMRIGKKLVICPSWETFGANADDIVITLDPGQAFGTGDHATTRQCLALVESYVMPNMRVLDLGCGSGILSIAAKLLGAAYVVGTDVEPLAVDVATENAQRNGVEITFLAGNGRDALPDSAEKFDLVISNIISAVLIRLAPDVASLISPGAPWIVSGIIPANWPDVQSAAEGSGFTLQSKQEEDGWVAAVFISS